MDLPPASETDPYVAPYLQVLEDLRRQLVAAVEPLSEEQLHRTIPGLRNSVAVLLRHVVGSERYWIGEVAGGRPAARNRDAEFSPTRESKAALLAELERVGRASRAVLERLRAEDLVRDVDVQRAGGRERTTVAGALLHATQHLAYHLGQVRYLARLV